MNYLLYNELADAGEGKANAEKAAQDLKDHGYEVGELVSLIDLDLEFETFFVDLVLHHVDEIIDERTQLVLRWDDLHLAFLNLGKIQNVIDK